MLHFTQYPTACLAALLLLAAGVQAQNTAAEQERSTTEYKGKEIERQAPPRLGIYMRELDNMVQISEVVTGSAAHKSGMMTGDFILRINEKEVYESSQVQSIVREQNVGSFLRIDYIRGGEQGTLWAILEATTVEPQTVRIPHKHHRQEPVPPLSPEQACLHLEQLQQTALLGIYMDTRFMPDKPGAIVTNFVAGTNAPSKIDVGDRIIEAAGIKVETHLDLKNIIEKHKAGDRLQLRLVRGDKTLKTSCILVSRSTVSSQEIEHLQWLCDQAQPQPQPQPQTAPEKADTKGAPRPEVQLSLSVFPNPTPDLLNVQIENASATEALHFNLFDASGKRCYERHSRSEGGSLQLQIDLSGLPAGIYTLHLQQGEHSLSQQVSLLP